MADLATAYVQVIPSAEGMKGKLAGIFGSEMPAGGKSAGGLFSSGLIGTVKAALATAGIGKALKDTILEGSEMQQLRGGVEKIFNDMDYSTILNDAAGAYENLNMSANQYLAKINDVGAAFAATMGDHKGYEVAKTGLQAISDYASGTGKNVETLSEKFAMITRSTSSYQSIADQFSGILPATSADFLKQAQAAGFLEGSYKKLTQVPVAEYQEAVALMLEKGTAELGLAGNTAAETATTISGSFAAMKASFSNVLGNLTLGQDIKPSLNALAQTTTNFLKGNLTPAVLNIVKALPGAAFTFMKAMIPGGVKGLVSTGMSSLTQFLTTSLPAIQGQGASIINNTVTGFLMGLPAMNEAAGTMLGQLSVAIISALPLLTESGFSIISSVLMGFLSGAPSFLAAAGTLLQTILQALMDAGPPMLESGTALILNLLMGIVNSLPFISEAALAVVSGLLNTFAMNFPNVLQSGVSMILNLASGILASLPQVAASAASIVTGLLSTFASYLPDLLAQGISMIGQLIAGAISMLPDVISAAGDICKGIWNAITEVDWISLGKAIIDGVLNGIRSAASSIFEAMKDIASKALQAAKDALGIHSPSRRARKEVGLPIAQGEALGITDGIPLVMRAQKQLADASLPDVSGYLRIRNRQPHGMNQDTQGGGKVVNIYMNVYSEAKSAADLMREARYQAETAVLLGV